MTDHSAQRSTQPRAALSTDGGRGGIERVSVRARALLPCAGPPPGVGVVGFLTGGGLGPVARTIGFSLDHVRAFEVVTGDGQLRRTILTDNPALFWGLRGGKGALGI